MDKLLVFFILCFSFIFLSSSIQQEPAKLYLELPGKIDRPIQGIKVSLQEITINNKKFTVSSDISDHTDTHGNFKLEYNIPLESIGLTAQNAGKELHAKTENIWTRFWEFLTGNSKKQEEDITITLKAQIYLNGQLHTIIFEPFYGPLKQLFETEQEKYILVRPCPSALIPD